MAFRSMINLTRLSNKVLISANLSKNALRCNSTLKFAPNPGLALPPHGVEETDEEFDRRFEGYFNDPEIDGWMLRKRMQDIHGLDLVPEPKIIIAALKACRRVNDYALATRYLEALKYKCGNDEKEIWPYIIQEITPTLKELGISTLEELGYDKPELAVESPYTS